MPSRRTLLASLPAVALATGCLTRTPGESGVASTTSTTTTPDDDARNASNETRSDAEPRPVRGTADVLPIERTVTGEQHEYVPSNDTVKYPKYRSGGDVSGYGYQSFDEWATIETASFGASALKDRFADEFPNSEHVPVALSAPTDELPFRLTVHLETRLDEDGNVISEPPMSKPETIAVTPETIRGTIHLADQTSTQSVPVYVVAVTTQEMG
ncbi:hypothetical protein G9C85_14135 [Halorubellus sp. JP-L1]|uniref:hypothetical protein n=1 Tax=Halorubellus sp. JP-L1 TaxID=2715753 RepID=UPI00140C7383|nr:hypothetical protein [Halorubellus sp. JP-L1]NHN42761.1 hypothetical protein [Halorubellus sp. JP-L1]